MITTCQTLTSLESLRILEGKEKKKKEELEMKAKRKKEREEKKKLRDEEFKKKAEKRAMREQERIKEAELKMEEKKKQEEAKKKQEEPKRKRDEATGRRKCSDEVKRKRRCFKDRPKESEAGQEREIDTSVCCTCDGSYEQDVVEGTGADWLACACGRWLHEECVDDCIRDYEGKDRIFPHCLDDLATMFV